MPPRSSALASIWTSKPLRRAALVWTVLCVACCVRTFVAPRIHTLYPIYANAGRCWVVGADAYDVERDASGAIIPRFSEYRYSPLVSIVFVPFSLVPNSLGGVVWRLLSFAGYLAAFAWFLREVLPATLQWSDAKKAVLWLLLIPLSLGSMNNGQANVLLMAFLLAAAAALVTERWNLTTLFLAGACFLKVYPLAIVLLMVLIYPRQLGWRCLLAAAAGLALPFALQDPSYVLGQYVNWYELVATDDRRGIAMNQGYRDFYLLTRFVGAPMHPTLYLALQLGAAATVALVCLVGRLRQWPKRHQIQTLLTLGCCWMTVFGPSTESCTFILLAPALAWALVDAFEPGRPRWSRAMLLLAMGMLLTTFMATWFPGGRDLFYVLQPLSALIFFAERLLSVGPEVEARLGVAFPTMQDSHVGKATAA